MAFSQTLAGRVRAMLDGVAGVTEREMFGGLAFMAEGNMCCTVVGEELMVRVGPDLYQDALTRPHVREGRPTGRPTRGMVYVGREGVADDAELELWIKLGLAYAKSRPRKKKR